MHSREMIRSHPEMRGSVSDPLIHCIDECYDCAQACIACADACVAEKTVDELKRCIRLTLDCADICTATGVIASRQTGSNQEVLRRLLETCAFACSACAEECERHARSHVHCQVCAEKCRRCAQVCREAMQTVH